MCGLCCRAPLCPPLQFSMTTLPSPLFHQGSSLGLLYTMGNNVLTAWSHSQSKSFADKWNCHGCVGAQRKVLNSFCTYYV